MKHPDTWFAMALLALLFILMMIMFIGHQRERDYIQRNALSQSAN